ncbi:MAG: aminotransferase class V-fold PLP-dependent enzyme [Pirellulales bacterium]
MTIYRQLDVPTVINAAGPVTRYGGSCLSRAVLAAMEEATESYVRLDQLQLAVGKRLASLAGTQAGYVTSGAAAGLTLGAAAIMAGMDVARMEQFPDTTGIPNEFILQRSHCGDYDHAIRAAGAKLVTVDCPEKASRDAIGRSLDSVRTARTCGAVYVFRTADRGVPLEDWVAACHGMGLPVLVDASVRLPPAENLRRIPASGADLVAFSGGKAVRGPQGTGLVVGRSDLIASILLQNQDMDVQRETWFLRSWLQSENGSPDYRQGGQTSENVRTETGLVTASKKLTRPPRNGIGRGMKVSKENVVGLLVALEEYLARDHRADLAAWNHLIDLLARELSAIDGCHVEIDRGAEATYPVPVGLLRLTQTSRIDLVTFVRECGALERPVLFEEGPLDKGYLVIHPMCLSKDDVTSLVSSVRQVLLRPRPFDP